MPWLNPADEAAWARKRYWRQARKGICTCCQKPWGGPHIICPKCKEKKKVLWSALAERYAKERRERNECTRCGQPLHPEADAGRAYCVTCRQRRV